uniref:Uncharacterized protein n=1 Tax=Anguilla anguilla TaxID=7936 RepID=A0A0E9RG43_ANGAN
MTQIGGNQTRNYISNL